MRHFTYQQIMRALANTLNFSVIGSTTTPKGVRKNCERATNLLPEGNCFE